MTVLLMFSEASIKSKTPAPVFPPRFEYLLYEDFSYFTALLAYLYTAVHFNTERAQLGSPSFVSWQTVAVLFKSPRDFKLLPNLLLIVSQ